jgi:predicted RNA methylase
MEERIECYESAIQAIVTRDSNCVDIGCDTGILSCFLEKAGDQRVTAIEYFSPTAKAA